MGSGVVCYLGVRCMRLLCVRLLVSNYDDLMYVLMFSSVVLCSVYRFVVVICGWIVRCCVLLVVVCVSRSLLW